jgi:hypothetical protein
VFGLVVSLVLVIVGSWLGLVLPAAYGVTVVGFAARSGGAPKLQVAFAFVTMHLAWGAGFLFGR